MTTFARVQVVLLSDRGASLAVDASTAMSGDGGPVALTDDAVVLAASGNGSTVNRYDLWVPARGRYVPSWNVITNVVDVYGPAFGGKLILGQVYPTPGSGDTCLAELDPLQSLHAVRTACGLLGPGAGVARSPDGHWLAVSQGSGKVALLDLTRAFDNPMPTATWTANGPGVWVAADAMVAHGSGRWERFRVGRPNPEPVDLPSQAPGGTVAPVPHA